MTDHQIIGLFVAACGLFSVCGAAFEWRFFMNSGKAQRMVRLIGHNGARLFYALLGSGLAAVGTAMTAGLLGD